jgi:hypothetical protein
MALYYEYLMVYKGKLKPRHIHLFIAVGIILGDTGYYVSMIQMFIAYMLLDIMESNKHLITNNTLLKKYPWLYSVIYALLHGIFLLALCSCLATFYEGFIYPLVRKFIYFLIELKHIIVRMSGFGSGSNNQSPSPNKEPNPTPSPRPDPSNPSPSTVSKKSQGKKKKESLKKYKERMGYDEYQSSLLDMGNELKRLNRANNTLFKKEHHHDNIYEERATLKEFWEKYLKALSSEDKKRLMELEDDYIIKREEFEKGYRTAISVQEY